MYKRLILKQLGQILTNFAFWTKLKRYISRSFRFLSDVSTFLFIQRNVKHMLSLKDVSLNFYIFQGKYNIHKNERSEFRTKM